MKLKLTLQAWKDLWSRYSVVFRHAWQQRHAMEGPGYTRHEAQFLPAALALQEAPLSPAPRIAMWMLIGFAAIALLWAIFGKIDVVATAQGRIVPNDRVKTIQPLENSVVQAIHVRDGQHVRAGEVLIELDATTTRADAERFAGDLAVAQLQVQRGRAMLAMLDTGKTPRLATQAGVDGGLHVEASDLLDGQVAEYRAQLARIDAEVAQREAERRSIQELIKKLEQTVPIARQRAEDYKGLVERKFMSTHGYLEREQVRIEQEADLATQRSRLLEVDAAIAGVRAQRAALQSETRRLNLDSINEGLQQVGVLEQELVKARSRDGQMRLTAPVDGTVQQLAVHTVGGVVTEAQPLMIIVPKDNPLEIEAFIENKDIGFVDAGQQAEVKVETFQYTKYGTIAAELVSVSSDAINDEKRGLIYAARARMERSSVDVDGRKVNLGPGMAVTVEIKTGKRRVIEYFLNPLMQYGNESLRER